jgi:CubicO group peptidase (beta-lactamase class C family)
MIPRQLRQRYACAGKSATTRMAVTAAAAAALLAIPLSGHFLAANRTLTLFSPLSVGVQTHTGPAPKLPHAKMAEKTAANAAVTMPPSPPGELTTADLSAFFDGLVPLQIKQDDIAGAVVAAVKDGQVIFAKGYGYSDVKAKKPVSPEDTLFRVGSISKLFTWTSVMQLVQAGKIDLDADIRQYLDFPVDEHLGKITMRDLMTHTPGFDESIKGLISENNAHMRSLGDYLKTHAPDQIFAPGTTGAYSNYGAGLAGYIVQRVSGQPFDDYVEQHIFQPLGMTHASFRQPLPANLEPLMSQGFQLGSGGPKPFELVNPAPAGALAISAMDITHFMIAHLQDGTYNGAQILDPVTVKEMHSRQYAPDPHVNGMCLGFYEDSRNGHRVIAHGGDTIYFHSDLHLILDADVGLFVSFNSAGRGEGEPRGPLYEQFMNRYFPYTPPTPASVATAAQDARSVSGTYIPSRRSQDNILYPLFLLSEGTVSPGKDGTLITGAKGLNGQTIEWHEEAPNIWYNPDDPQSLITFDRQPDGRWQMGAEFPADVLQQVGFTQSKGFVQNSLIAILIVFVLVLILWPISALIRWHYGRQPELSIAERRARRSARLVAILDLLFWILFAATIMQAGTHLSILSSKMDWWFRVMQIIGWLGILATIICVINYFRQLGAQGRWWWAKIQDVIIVLAALMSIWLIIITHVLSFSLKY